MEHQQKNWIIRFILWLKSRYNKKISLQQQISDENLKKQIGNKLEVLIEDESFDGKYYIARSENEVPDIDGIIYVEKSEDELLDKFVKVEIIGNKDYDMIGKLIK